MFEIDIETKAMYNKGVRGMKEGVLLSGHQTQPTMWAAPSIERIRPRHVPDRMANSIGGFVMTEHICELCKVSFRTNRQPKGPNRFCSWECFCIARREGWFPKVGFQKGGVPPTIRPVGSVHIQNKGGKLRAYVKVENQRRWSPRSHIVWASHYGAVPNGMILHHKDGSTLNDDIGNLELLTIAEHLRIHRNLKQAERKQGK